MLRQAPLVCTPVFRSVCAPALQRWYSRTSRLRHRDASAEPILLEDRSSVEPGRSSGRVSVHHFSANLNLAQAANLFAQGEVVRNQDNLLLVRPDVNFPNNCFFIFKKGGVVSWFAEASKEKQVLSDLEKCRIIPPRSVITTTETTQSEREDASEDLVVVDADETTRNETEIRASGTIHLSISQHRKSDQLAISLALVSAVRLNLIENKIENCLIKERALVDELQSSWRTPWTSSRISEKLFYSAVRLHQMRNDLNNEQGLLEIPDILWDFNRQEKLYQAIQDQFDLEERVTLLNGRLTWTMEYLNCFSTFIEHKHASRLETIIILLITFELLVALRMEMKK